MKKTDPRWNDVSLTESSGNVFVDLGFPEPEARVLLMRTEVMSQLKKHIAARGWTQTEAAKQMGITQPRVSKLLRNASEEFSLDMLLTLAARIGLRPELKLAA